MSWMIKVTGLAGCLAGLLPGLPQAAADAFDSVVVINEIHYHPAGADDPGLEFVELYNQNDVNVDLSGWRLSGGIDFVFPERTILAGGRYLVVAANPGALEAAAGITGVLGPFSGMLDNGGERVRLRNHNDRIMDEVDYNDRNTWPVGADGSGASLSKLDPRSNGARSAQWSHSWQVGGTPKAVNFVGAAPPAITLNEVAGGAAAEGAFFIELHNGTGAFVDLEGYVLAGENGEEHVIAPGVTMAADAVVNLSEAVLGFRLGDRDKLYLYEPGGGVVLDALRVDEEGRARIPDGSGPLGATGGELPETPGQLNPDRAPSPVVINEIMYHHRPTYEDVGPPAVSYAENDEEWIELHNTADVPVAVGGWELDGAVRFVIPEGVTIVENGYLVLCNDLDGFRSKFPGVPAAGPFSGSLSNQGEELLLLNADGNEVDRVFYRDDAPWPREADGGGSSLELINPHVDNASPTAWSASDNSEASEWQTYEFTMQARNPVYSPALYSFHELRLGLLDAGVVLLDDVSVIEDPGGAARELMPNGGFNGISEWKLIGTHEDSRPIADAGERVLRVVAKSRMNYLNNLIEGNLLYQRSPRPVQNGATYRISFRAKWISGTPQFRFELYYNKLARTVILKQPEAHGTPGARNSTYAAETGPIFRDLTHEPAVPRPGRPVEVSTVATDPDGIATLTLRYKVNSGAFLSVPMSLDPEDGRWKGIIPGQSNGALIQFYLEGEDTGGWSSVEPAGGARSRALIKVDSALAHGRKRSIRVLMVSSDATAMHNEPDILSNSRMACTIITDEQDIAYNAGIRLRGSMFSRRNRGTTGLNLKFPSDRLYRGVHETITTRRGNMREIVVKHIANQAGDIHDNYNDLIYQYGHIPEQSGMVRMEMARFGSNYLRGLPGGDGTEGTVFKMEGIREFQATRDGTRHTAKLPFPIGWISNFDIADQRGDKEIYRHNMRINSNLEIDDYDSIIRMCRTFSQSGLALERAVPSAIDVDRWARQFAVLSLCGIGDTYSQGNPHNLNFYVRPGDGLVEPMPWDWDFTFNRSTNASLWGDRNVSKIFARPVYTRLFHGHLYNIIRTTYNTRYLTSWFQHYGSVAGENYSGNLSYVTDRGNYVLSQLPRQVPFRIVTADGTSVQTPTVTLQGVGWIDVREIFLNDAPVPLEVRWLDADSWSATVPLSPGSNSLSLTAIDHEGREVGSDVVEIINTGIIEPAGADNLAVGEIMYHPAGDAAEEYVELVNISPAAQVDLGGVSFTNGIEFAFSPGTLLAPGERILVVQDRAAFEGRYGTDSRIAGVFENGTRLSNGGETLRLESLGGEVIREFAYGTRAPWPEAADGSGYSLVLVAPTSDPDHRDPVNWRASVEAGGSPGGSDATVFVGDPDGDDNQDGLSNLMNYALGAGGGGPFVQVGAGGELTVRHSRNLAADDVKWMIDVSNDLENWQVATGEFAVVEESLPVGGVAEVLREGSTPVSVGDHVLFIRLRVEKR